MAKKKNFRTMMEGQMKRGALPENVLESREWYRRKAIRMRELQGANSKRILKIGRENDRMKATLKSRLMLGKMWMFEYSPKLIDKLPYYDRFPCIFAIESHADGFLGINLHYLPYMFRAMFMDNLYGLLTDENMDEKTRLRLFVGGYNILKKAAKYRYFKPCIKKYLLENATSRFMEIPPDEWEIALFLPLERFVGATKRQVWKDSRNIIKGL